MTDKTHEATCLLLVGTARKEVKPGQKVCKEDFNSEEQFTQAVKSGSLIPIGTVAPEPDIAPVGGKDDDDQDFEHTSGNFNPLSDAEKGKLTPISKFMLNPETLKELDLDQLNVMLVEREVEPCETVEEAIALLSQDFDSEQGQES